MPTSKESFLDLYLKYTNKQESPAMFHMCAGLSLLSIALGRKCFINRGYYVLYPNLFTLLVAGSARCRKTTCIYIARNLLVDLEKTGRIKVISGKITPEKFIAELSERPDPTAPAGVVRFTSPDVLVFASELSVMLTKQSYGEALIHVLTDLFDCPDEWTYKTKGQGEVKISNAYVTILGATTPTSMAHGISPSALHDGFISRVLPCFQADTDRRNAFPEVSEEEKGLYNRLRIMLSEIGKLEGEFILGTEVRKWFVDWYNNHMDSDPADTRAEGSYGRKHDHLLRLGMLFAASWLDKEIEIFHLDAARMHLDMLEQTSGQAFAEMGGDETTPHLARLRSIIRRCRVMPHSILLMKMYPVNAAVFKVIAETAIQSGWMKRDGAKGNVYVWTGDD